MAKLYDRPEICRTYFFPQPARPLPTKDTAAPVDLHLPDGTRLGAYWSHPLDGAPTLLYVHGNGECIADQLHHWPDWARYAGANIFFVDYPGYASSDGKPTFTSCRQTARAALDFLLDQEEDKVPAVVVMGRSVGSIFALDAVAQTSSTRLAGLALESGIADVGQRLDIRVPYDQLGLNRRAVHAELNEDFDHEAKLRALRCPVLILHTRHDSLVPAENSERLANWAGPNLLRLLLFEQGDHNDIQWVNEPAYRAALTEFIGASTRKSSR
ncbi:MAG: alpha/beta hydrolase [Deltaproteobacteria bacterium]|nr:alpha/beta hydrolase [Deltaproteobacteria bacterium]